MNNARTVLAEEASISTADLTFKKAFGIDTRPVESFMWHLELRGATFSVESQGRTFLINAGTVGVDDKEKWAIGLFKHADERDPRSIHEIPSLNLSTTVELDIPRELDDRVAGAANDFVEPFVQSAFQALQRLVEAYRDAKYLAGRGTTQWVENRGVFVREMSLRSFRTYLFYVLNLSERKFVGTFSDGYAIMVERGNQALRDSVTLTLTGRVPLARLLMLRAWDSFFEGDFRSAIVDAATVIEVCLGHLMRKKLLAAQAGSKNRITKFISETSNRHVVTVVGALVGLETEKWREGVAASLDTRHALVHGGKRYASQGEARSAIDHAERLLILAEQLPEPPDTAAAV